MVCALALCIVCKQRSVLYNPYVKCQKRCHAYKCRRYMPSSADYETWSAAYLLSEHHNGIIIVIYFICPHIAVCHPYSAIYIECLCPGMCSFYDCQKLTAAVHRSILYRSIYVGRNQLHLVTGMYLTTSYNYCKHALLWHYALAHPLVYSTMRMALLAYLRHLNDGISYAKARTKRQILEIKS